MPVKGGLKTRRTQEERSSAAQAKLINSAIELICENSFANTTTEKIAVHAGMTRGAIQHHFNDRAELYAAILKGVEAHWLQAFPAAGSTGGGTIENRITVLMDNLWGVISSPAYRAVLDICMNSRIDQKLRVRVEETMDTSSRLFKKHWYQTFPEIPRKQIDEIREFVTAFAQGVVVSEIFTAQPNRLPPSSRRTFIKVKDLARDLILAARDQQSDKLKSRPVG